MKEFQKGLSWVAILILSSVPLLAKADFIQEDDPRFGPNSLTLDTTTGLVWLDVPLSTDLSYNQVEAAVQSGGQFAGFRHATDQEVLSLFNSAGFDEGFIPQTSSDFQRVQSLISLVGATNPDGVGGITGSLHPEFGDGVAVGFALLSAFNGEPGYNVTASVGNPQSQGVYFGHDTHLPSIGNWLVIVPEPSSALLILMGASALFLRRKALT